jgi:hypothetical protein
MGLSEFFNSIKNWFANLFGQSKPPTPPTPPTPTPTPEPEPTPEPDTTPTDAEIADQLENEVEAVQEVIDNLKNDMTVEELTVYNDVEPTATPAVESASEHVAKNKKDIETIVTPIEPLVETVPIDTSNHETTETQYGKNKTNDIPKSYKYNSGM